MDYGQVQLGDGPVKRQLQQNQQLLLDVDEDSLLRPFRVRARLAAPASTSAAGMTRMALRPDRRSVSG
jgi:hypothetical protein